MKEYNPQTGLAVIEQRNNMKVGEEIEIMQPGAENIMQKIEQMYDAEGAPIEVAPHPQQIITMPMSKPVTPYAMLRRPERRRTSS